MPTQPAQLRVRNWTQFQHYKDRNPPWIKLHFALLSSEDWVTLDDASKLLAVVCMLVASRNEGMVPNNPAYLKRVAYLDRLPKLKPLIDCGFLEIPQADAIRLQANDSAAQADARPETETDTDKTVEPNGSLSETSSDAAVKSGKAKSYPDAFEAFWKSYPRTPNMSKSKALVSWNKLSAVDRQKCSASITAYIAFLASKPGHPEMHVTTFINERRFDGFHEAVAPTQPPQPASEADWQKRLAYARKEETWLGAKWGPMPGQDSCLVPNELIQAGDGENWKEWSPT